MRIRLAAFAVLLVAAPSARAATFSFSIVTSSPLTVPGITLDGDDQSQAFAIVTQAAYTGGSNTRGWKIQAKATIPTAPGGATLPALAVTAGSFACVGACASSPSPTSIAYPITLGATAQTVYNAAAGTGQGTFRITSTYLIAYPAGARAGTYSSTVTLTGSTGP